MQARPWPMAYFRVGYKRAAGGARPRERGDLDAHRDEQRDASAHGAIGLPARSAAGLSGRSVRLAAVSWHAGAGIGTDGLEHDPEKWVPVSRLREALCTVPRLA